MEKDPVSKTAKHFGGLRIHTLGGQSYRIRPVDEFASQLFGAGWTG